MTRAPVRRRVDELAALAAAVETMRIEAAIGGKR